jgi:integrase
MSSVGTQLSSVPLPSDAIEGNTSWTEFLKNRIVENWRPGQFDFHNLLFVPDLQDPHTILYNCVRSGCGVLLYRGNICPSCRVEWIQAEKETGISKDEWAITTPRVRPERPSGCLVKDCQRTHGRFGLCASHAETYTINRGKVTHEYTVEEWIRDRGPRPFPPRPECSTLCGKEARHRSGLCGDHARRYQTWRQEKQLPEGNESLGLWLERAFEPLMDVETGATYAQACATPFGFLAEPLRWELLYAVQTRDLEGRAKINPGQLRGTYLKLRRQGASSVVGQTALGRGSGTDRNLAGMLTEWQRHIDDAHREWSGIDARESKVIYLRDLEIRETTKVIGPLAKMDLRGIQQDWVFQTVSAWARNAAHGTDALKTVAAAWTVADEVLRVRGTATNVLGTADMDAIVKAIRKRWPRGETQSRQIKAIDRVIAFARRSTDGQISWDEVPARFAIDKARHQAIEGSDSGAPDPDEPFRFVPQPIIDWIMDHLDLIDRGDPYATAEARAMIFIHERCGRRTGETMRLREDCITYDTQGSAYLSWRRGKPPFTMGKRLPIHQETHDLIRQWQAIKRERGVRSEWLFPSHRYTTVDKPYEAKYLNKRIAALIDAVIEHAPYEKSVEGADGNLVYFDLKTIDAYSFRHAFAQRFADATDADGRPTTPVDVLQDYMGHKNFNTTMAYYEVTAKRRKKALESMPARRINLAGQVVQVDRERDQFTKVAVSLGHCSEPQNVAAGGDSCMLSYACESCPFFLVDPFERDGMEAKRHHLRVQLERARIIQSPQHMIDHYSARIKDCTKIIDGIDLYIEALPAEEQNTIKDALSYMAEVRRRATAPRKINLRTILLLGDMDAL